MITVRHKGNATIQVTTGGTKVKGGTQWSVYPYIDNDPTLQKFDEEKKSRIEELTVTGFREKGDLSGKAMQTKIGEAIALLYDNLGGREHTKDLGLVANKVDIKPDGELAKFLETEYGITSIEKESQTSAEVKG